MTQVTHGGGGSGGSGGCSMRVMAEAVQAVPPAVGAGFNGKQRPPAPPLNPALRKKGEVQPWMKAVAGSVGGIVEACCLQPVDVMKTRLQLDSTGTYPPRNGPAGRLRPPPPLPSPIPPPPNTHTPPPPHGGPHPPASKTHALIPARALGKVENYCTHRVIIHEINVGMVARRSTAPTLCGTTMPRPRHSSRRGAPCPLPCCHCTCGSPS